MNLDERFPDAAVDLKTADGFLKRKTSDDCAQCGKPTAWIHLGLAVPLCSRDCYEKLAAAQLRGASTWLKDSRSAIFIANGLSVVQNKPRVTSFRHCDGRIR